MNDFHYETFLLQSADQYGSVTNSERFSQPLRTSSCFTNILQPSKEYFREKYDWFVNRLTNILPRAFTGATRSSLLIS